MALVRAGVDQWVLLAEDLPWLAPGYGLEIFLGRDDLTPDGYEARVEVGGGDLGLRCARLIPAGFWIRPTRSDPPLYLPPREYTTTEFRRDVWGHA